MAKAGRAPSAVAAVTSATVTAPGAVTAGR